MKKLVESKKIIFEEIEGFEEVISEKEDYLKAQSRLKDIEQEIKEYPIEEIDKSREAIRWKKGMNYYMLNPKKFDFRIKDL